MDPDRRAAVVAARRAAAGRDRAAPPAPISTITRPPSREARGKQLVEVGSKAAGESIGRVAEDEVVAAPRRARRKRARRARTSSAAIAEIESRSTLRAAGRGVGVDERRRAAPRESASIASAPVPAEEVEHVEPGRRRRGSRRAPRGPGRCVGRIDLAARRGDRACPRALRRRRASLRRRSARRARRRTGARTASSSGPSSGASSEPCALEQRDQVGAGRRRGAAASSGRRRDPEPRQAALARPEHLALAAQRRGRPRRARSRRARGRSPRGGSAPARSRGRRRGCSATRARRGRSARGAGGAG